MNVREAVENVLSRVASDMRAAKTAVSAPAADPSAEIPAPPAPETDAETPTATEQRRQAERPSRAGRFRRVKELAAEDVSIREIARRWRVSRGAVLRHQRLETCLDWRPCRTKATAVDPFAAVIAAWVAAGSRNAANLSRELKANGFTGRYDAARRYLNRLIGRTGRHGKRAPNAPPTPAERTPPSARKLSFRVANPKPDSHSARVHGELRAGSPAVHGALGLAEELMGMTRRTTATPLADWLAKAKVLGARDLANVATSLGSDAAAVQAAVTEAWSNGPVEGQVNRLKAIKRSMYGRAGMKRLRARVRHKG